MANNFKAVELLNELLLEMGFTSGVELKLGGNVTHDNIDVIKFNLPYKQFQGDVNLPDKRNYYLLYCKSTNKVTILTSVFEILEVIWDIKDGEEFGKVKKYINLTSPDSIDTLKIVLKKLKKAHLEIEVKAVETLVKQLGGDKEAYMFLGNWIASIEDTK